MNRTFETKTKKIHIGYCVYILHEHENGHNEPQSNKPII